MNTGSRRIVFKIWRRSSTLPAHALKVNYVQDAEGIFDFTSTVNL